MNKGKSERLPTLDLHGAKTDEVYDRLEQFLARENSRGSARVRVMPGKGTGKVKSEVIDYLKRANYPWQYEKSGSGAANEGVLLVFLD